MESIFELDSVQGEPVPDSVSRDIDSIAEAAHLLLITDQTLRAGLQVHAENGRLTLQGRVDSPAQKSWADVLLSSTGAEVDSRLEVAPIPSHQVTKPADVDDESLQALVLLRLRLVRETEHLPVKVKAHRGVVTFAGQSPHGSLAPAGGEYYALDAWFTRAAQLAWPPGLSRGDRFPGRRGCGKNFFHCEGGQAHRPAQNP